MKINKTIANKLKKLSYKQAKKLFKLKPNGDIDRDGVKNKHDCRPFDKKKHKELLVNDKLYTLYEDIKFHKAKGDTEEEIVTKLKNRGNSSQMIRYAWQVFLQERLGYVIANADAYNYGNYD